MAAATAPAREEEEEVDGIAALFAGSDPLTNEAEEEEEHASGSGFYTQALPLHADDHDTPTTATATATVVHVTLALDDGAAPASLFAFSVWNGARRLAAHLTQHPRLVHGRTVVEFGAAGALPSLAALRLGCRFALLTDFPAAPLLGAMRRTLADPRNAPVLGRGLDRCAAVRGHLWGADPTPLLAALPDDGEARAGGGGFDVALVGECLWLHHQHANLLASIHGCLRPGGQALVSFSHHVPGCERQDLAFFEKATREPFWFEVKRLGEGVPLPHAHAAGRMALQFLYRLTKQDRREGEGKL